MYKDLTGEVFCRLTALSAVGIGVDRRPVWSCLCSCGSTVSRGYKTLVQGKNQSCGCLKVKHGRSKDDVYMAWAAMKDRCSNPNSPNYKHYGGRGIKVCERWEFFENFIQDMGERPTGMTLDRIDNNGGYELANCRWATWEEQCGNKRPHPKTRTLELGGESHTVSEWAKITGIKKAVIFRRLYLGWSVSEALHSYK